MIATHSLNLAANKSSGTKSIFSSYLELYEPNIPVMDPSDLVRFQIDDDILDDNFIAGIDLTEEQLAFDMSMCRYFEGAE